MAHAVTGDALAITWGGGAVNGKGQNWRLRFEGEQANDRGAGESWDSLVPTFSRWEVTFELLALDQADWSISSTVAETALINATGTVSLKRKSGDTNPYFTATGLTVNIERDHRIGEASRIMVTVRCSEGTAPTIDTTPAS